MRTPRPPAWLKRALLPAWNGGHRLGRRAGMVLGAVASGRVEHCDCCGATAPMLFERRIIPDRLAELWGLTPRQAEAFARKESLGCARCGAKLRGRRIARTLLDLYPLGDGPADSLASWARTPEAGGLRVAELNRIDGVHEALAGLPGMVASEFAEGAEPGAIVGGRRHEDLTRLTFPNGSLDLVLTSETLEHVPDLPGALAEILRVLTPGGRHVFTVPIRPGVAATFARALVEADGSVRDLATRICHPGGDSGYPVFTEFGDDLPRVFREAGFEVAVRFGPATDDDVAQVFACRKPAGSRS